MTREEAIRKLQEQKAKYLEEWVDFSGVAEAFDMAIEALEQPEQLQDKCEGCYYKDGMGYQCENCARYFPDRYTPE